MYLNYLQISRKFQFALVIFGHVFLMACSSSSIKTTPETATATADSGSVENRTTASVPPQKFMYRGFECSSGDLNLISIHDPVHPVRSFMKDGFAHLYSNKDKDQTHLVAVEVSSESSNTLPEEIYKIGEMEREGKIEAIFRIETEKTLSKSMTPKVGEKCSPTLNPYFLSHKWKSEYQIKFKDLSEDAAKILGVNPGESRTFNCQEEATKMVTCPRSGKFSKADLK